MLTSLALVFLIGLTMAWLAARLRLPRIVGMLLAGMLLGPYVLNVLHPSLLNISAELRRAALVIILLRAGLSLDLGDLKKVGRPALLLSFLPASLEILGAVLLAPRLLHVSAAEAAVLGAVLGAVSPAVVVPRMVQLMDTRYGTRKGIPQMILAGASLDDVFVIVLFTSFTALAQSGTADAASFLDIPVAIVLGIAPGILAGLALALFFRRAQAMRSTVKTIVMVSTAFLLLGAEEALKGTVAVSGLLAIMAMAMTIRAKSPAARVARLSQKCNKLWLGAEDMLFVLVGAAVDIRYTMEAGAGAVLLILLALLFRSVGTWLCTLGTPLNMKERLYCVLAYLPKATVQAAIGGVPLAMGLPCGALVLSVAVVSILITAPLGAFAMDASYKRLLEKEAEA